MSSRVSTCCACSCPRFVNCRTKKAKTTMDKIESVIVRHGKFSANFSTRPKVVVAGLLGRFVMKG